MLLKIDSLNDENLKSSFLTTSLFISLTLKGPRYQFDTYEFFA